MGKEKRKRSPRPISPRIPLSEPFLGGNEWKYVRDCLDTGWVSSVGKYVNLFEEKVAEFTGARFAVSTVNGTAALHTALLLAGVKPGDRVIVPTLTFIATVNPVIYCGAVPVFVDCEEETLNIDPGKAVQTIRGLFAQGQGPKAMIVTHLYGHPCHIDPILAVAREHGVIVIEDACESLGSKYQGKMTGTLGEIGCLSFNGNKIITTGGGGMLVTNQAAVAERARYLTTQARDDATEYIHKDVGYNYRLTNLQAAVGLAQMEQLPLFLEKKKRIAAFYRTHLGGVAGAKYIDEPPRAESNFWLNTVLLEKKREGVNTRALIQNLKGAGVETRPIFSPVHSQECFRRYCFQSFPVAEACSGIHLPSSIDLTEEELFFTVAALKKHWECAFRGKKAAK